MQLHPFFKCPYLFGASVHLTDTNGSHPACVKDTDRARDMNDGDKHIDKWHNQLKIQHGRLNTLFQPSERVLH